MNENEAKEMLKTIDKVIIIIKINQFHFISYNFYQNGSFLILNEAEFLFLIIYFNKTFYKLEIRQSKNNLIGLGTLHKDCETVC